MARECQEDKKTPIPACHEEDSKHTQQTLLPSCLCPTARRSPPSPGFKWITVDLGPGSHPHLEA